MKRNIIKIGILLLISVTIINCTNNNNENNKYINKDIIEIVSQYGNDSIINNKIDIIYNTYIKSDTTITKCYQNEFTCYIEFYNSIYNYANKYNVNFDTLLINPQLLHDNFINTIPVYNIINNK